MTDCCGGFLTTAVCHKKPAEAEMAAQEEVVHVKKELQWKRDVWLASSILTSKLAGNFGKRESEMEVLAYSFSPWGTQENMNQIRIKEAFLEYPKTETRERSWTEKRSRD